MNIAILLTNSIRLNHNIKENIDWFLSDLDLSVHTVDIFCSAWYTKDINLKEAENALDFKVFDLESQNEYTDSLMLNYENYNNFLNTYVNEDPLYNDYSKFNFTKGGGIHSLYAIYKINRGYNIIKSYSKKNNIKYDLILKTRFDFEFCQKLSESHLVECKNENAYFGKDSRAEYNLEHMMYTYTDGWIGEEYFYANDESFEKISNLYYSYYDLSLKHNTWITHVWFKKYLKEISLPFKKSSIFGRLRRPNGIWEMTIYNM